MCICALTIFVGVLRCYPVSIRMRVSPVIGQSVSSYPIGKVLTHWFLSWRTWISLILYVNLLFYSKYQSWKKKTSAWSFGYFTWRKECKSSSSMSTNRSSCEQWVLMYSRSPFHCPMGINDASLGLVQTHLWQWSVSAPGWQSSLNAFLKKRF